MAEQRSTIEFSVDGLSIAALIAGPAGTGASTGTDTGTGTGAGREKPLIAALHGGTYTARYFDVAGSPRGTFMNLAAAAGYPVVSSTGPGTARARRWPRRRTPSTGTRACWPARSRRPRRGSRRTACSWPGTRSAE